MRILVISALLALAACASGGGAGPAAHAAASPFPVQRGTAPPPPQANAPSQAAPLQGRASGGVDFGQWRTAEQTTYAASFQTQIALREQGKDAAAIQADLRANGFACDTGARLDCRIEIMDSQCGVNWYVVVDDAGVHAGFERMCLGANSN